MPTADRQKIAVVRSSYSPFGGVETLTLEILRALLERNVAVTLLTWPEQEWPLNHPKLKIVPLGSHRGNRLWQAWSFKHCVERYLATRDFGIVFALDRLTRFTHLHAGGGTHATFLDLKNAQAPPIQRLFRKMSLFHAYILHLESLGFATPLLRKVQCCSQMVADDIRQRYRVPPEKLRIIYNGVNWQEISEAFGRRERLAAELREKYDLGVEPWLLFLGSGFTRKGLDVAIAGLLHLPEKYRLLVIGKGNAKRFRRLARDLGIEQRVRFLGPQPTGWRFAAISRGLLLPSRYEPFGLAAAEAQAMGLPVLVSDQTGFAELVEPGQTGVIIPARPEAADLRDGFQRLEPLLELSENAREAIRAHIAFLDNRLILARLLDDFLSVGELENPNSDSSALKGSP